MNYFQLIHMLSLTRIHLKLYEQGPADEAPTELSLYKIDQILMIIHLCAEDFQSNCGCLIRMI